MGTINTNQESFLVYEETELGLLVAISKTNQLLIKKFWKKKGKGDDLKTTVPAHPFIQTEEQDSLKIDFTQTNQYEIKNLKKFD